MHDKLPRINQGQKIHCIKKSSILGVYWLAVWICQACYKSHVRSFLSWLMRLSPGNAILF